MKKISAYGAYAKDTEVQLKSSSGGVFSLFSEYILSKKGIVYGVAMSSDTRTAEFIRVTDCDGLARLRGSKYLQAYIGETYKSVKADLENDVMVLFSGTECQVNGLKGYLKKSYRNLYCIGLICHGVPSPALWKEYVEYMENLYKGKFDYVNFRYKRYGWFDFGMLHNTLKKRFYSAKESNPYLLFFLRNYCLRPSCYECISKEYKLSDLTIGDFWSVKQFAPKINNHRGVSLVIARTEKGQNLFDAIANNTIYHTVDYSEELNILENQSSERPPERSDFFIDMYQMSFEELSRRYAVPSHISLIRKIKRLIRKMMLGGQYFYAEFTIK